VERDENRREGGVIPLCTEKNIVSKINFYNNCRLKFL
jgi:hypothetical protein